MWRKTDTAHSKRSQSICVTHQGVQTLCSVKDMESWALAFQWNQLSLHWARESQLLRWHVKESEDAKHMMSLLLNNGHPHSYYPGHFRGGMGLLERTTAHIILTLISSLLRIKKFFSTIFLSSIMLSSKINQGELIITPDCNNIIHKHILQCK